MVTGPNQWLMPKEWLWVDYPDGWVETLMGTRWPESQHNMFYARWLTLHVNWDLDGNKPWDEMKKPREGQGIEWTPLGGILFISRQSEFEWLTVSVGKARSQGYTWAQIGAALGVGRAAAQKRFGDVDPVAESDSEDGLKQIQRDLRVWSCFDTLLRDLVIEARCEGWGWADIGDGLGVAMQAAQKRFGQGLAMERVRQLDDELVWASQSMPDQWRRSHFQEMLKRRRRARLKDFEKNPVTFM